MHQTVQCCFGKPTWRNWQTRTVQVRVPRGMRVRLPPSVPYKKGCQTLEGFEIFCGYGITAVHQPSKLDIRVRLPLPAPVAKLIKIYQTIFNVAGFPSGQRGQTVNLLAMLSVVRIHLQPPFFEIQRQQKCCRFFVFTISVPQVLQIFLPLLNCSYKMLSKKATVSKDFLCLIFQQIFSRRDIILQFRLLLLRQ